MNARGYHQATKHSPRRLRARRCGLDRATLPDPFKRYPALDAVRLPEDLPAAGVPALDALAGGGRQDARLDLAQLGRLLRLGAGVHPRRALPGQHFRFRTYMSAGALYPVELYAVTAPLEALGAGVWHFHPGEGALRRLRQQDARPALAAAAAAPELEEAAGVLVLSGISWRTTCTYGARGWRHVFWDAGTMLANLLALAASAGLAPRLRTAFLDASVAGVPGVRPPRVTPVALPAVGRSHAARASS